MSADFSPQERQRLISMYTTQYNQTNLHINRLFNTLDDIRHNLNTLISSNTNNNNTNNNMDRQYRLNRPTRQNNIREDPNHNYNRDHTSLNQSVYYDYSNPIDRSTYVGDVNDNNSDITNFLSDIITNNTSNINARNNSPEVNRFLTNFLNSVPVRPTQAQINNASSLVRYSDIQNPNSSSCAILLEPFTPSDSVRHLHHCGHIFFPEQFNQWFSNNVRCPVCRHDIRNTTVTSINLMTNIIDQLTSDLLTSENSNNPLTSITNRLNGSSNNNTNNNTNTINHDVLFETMLQSNNL